MKNFSGKISSNMSFEDFQKLVQNNKEAMQNLSQDSINNFFKGLDEDGDGKINESELKAFSEHFQNIIN